jgi:hypothetical protein
VYPVGLGRLSTTQLVPFQRSARTDARPLSSVKLPTAKQAVVDGQEMADSDAVAVEASFGVVMTRQFAPFQRSTSGRLVADELPNPLPTARHSVAEGHDTPCSDPLATDPAASATPIGPTALATSAVIATTLNRPRILHSAPLPRMNAPQHGRDAPKGSRKLAKTDAAVKDGDASGAGVMTAHTG